MMSLALAALCSGDCVYGGISTNLRDFCDPGDELSQTYASQSMVLRLLHMIQGKCVPGRVVMIAGLLRMKKYGVGMERRPWPAFLRPWREG